MKEWNLQHSRTVQLTTGYTCRLVERVGVECLEFPLYKGDTTRGEKDHRHHMACSELVLVHHLDHACE